MFRYWKGVLIGALGVALFVSLSWLIFRPAATAPEKKEEVEKKESVTPTQVQEMLDKAMAKMEEKAKEKEKEKEKANPVPSTPAAPVAVSAPKAEAPASKPVPVATAPVSSPPVGPATLPSPAPSNLDGSIKEFFGTGMPQAPRFENEKQAKGSRQREEWLVAKMFSDSPATDRASAATELGNYPFYRVARALSFVVGNFDDGRRKTGDKFEEVREAAAVSLGKIGNVEFVPTLEDSAKTDESEKVKVAAKNSAEQIKARAGSGLSTSN